MSNTLNVSELSGAKDFDFFVGNWAIKHRRLKERLVNCDQWEEFNGSSSMQKILGGMGNLDDNVLEMPSGTYRAVTLRTFEAETGLWSIWWLDGRNPTQIDTPVRGRFEKGVGQFYADDTLAGQAIRVRFLWICNAPDRPRWEQAFSTDGGLNWETNWIMDFYRSGQ